MQDNNEWKKICAACAEGTPPERCAYYGEPDGCNAPVRGQHPAGDVAERLKDELADAHDAIARLEAELADARRERDTACAERALSAAPGNAAAMRAALEHVCHMDDNGYTSYDVHVAMQKAHDALSAPARNCDRCEFWEDLWGLEFVKLWPDVTDDLQRAWLFVRWLFDKAEGGAK